jgi:hypothetical protein
MGMAVNYDCKKFYKYWLMVMKLKTAVVYYVTMVIYNDIFTLENVGNLPWYLYSIGTCRSSQFHYDRILLNNSYTEFTGEFSGSVTVSFVPGFHQKVSEECIIKPIMTVTNSIL